MRKFILNEEDTVKLALTPDMLNNPDSVDIKKFGQTQIKRIRQDREAREAQAKKDAFMKEHSQVFDTIKNAKTEEDKLQVLFDEFVPSSGKSECLAGELARAMMRILYRDFNDGDRFFSGYGIETCGASATFLTEQIPDAYDALVTIAENNLKDDAYTKALDEVAGIVVDYVLDNPESIAEPTTDMLDSESDNWKELEPTVEIEVSSFNFGSPLFDYMDDYSDIIDYSMRDLYDELDADFSYDDIEVSMPFADVINVTCIEEDEDRITREISDILDRVYDELVDQYGENPEEEE